MNNQADEFQNEPWSDEMMASINESDVVDAIDAGTEGFQINHLNQLGNRAVNLRLISGHGFYRGQYELLQNRESVLMTPLKAQEYLEDLLATAEANA